jgi:hypothetical protein
MTPTRLYILLAAATAMAGLLCIGGVVLAERLDRRSSRRLLALFAVTFLALLPFPFASIWPISLVVLLGLGVFGGVAIGRSLVTTGSIVAFLVVVSVVDMVSFRGGPTAWILETYRTGTNELLLHLALTFPLRGHMVPLIGVGDLVVMSAIIAATRWLAYPTTEVAMALGLALLIALAVGLLAGGIYLLPFVAVTVGPYLLIRRRFLLPRVAPGHLLNR